MTIFDEIVQEMIGCEPAPGAHDMLTLEGIIDAYIEKLEALEYPGKKDILHLHILQEQLELAKMARQKRKAVKV